MEIDQEDNNLNEILKAFSDIQSSDVEFTKNCLKISTGKYIFIRGEYLFECVDKNTNIYSIISTESFFYYLLGGMLQ